ncbi:GOLPH3/VPS74 family protein [Humidisolicoccus flavus]|uniref:GOLPH3/VPS74 family protein n=1 Tax=Humidisolicoccus flavus TaxID=3111414 RepID=UPI00324A83D9
MSDSNANHVSTNDGGHDPLIAEDLMLVLFLPKTGTFASESMLYSLLGGAILSDLILGNHVTVNDRGLKGTEIATTPNMPADELLRESWEYLSKKPRDVQTLLAAMGPKLRAPVIERLIERGELVRQEKKFLGLFPTKVLRGNATGRREYLRGLIRATLVDGEEPDTRTATITAFISASGALPHFHPEIPWNSKTIARAKEFEQGNWGSKAVAAAVVSATTAVIVSTLVTTTMITRS